MLSDGSRSASLAWFLGVELTHRWSGQVIETPDGLPYIGQSAEHQYSATGYAGNGLTFGTLAGMMISDAILGASESLERPVRSAIGKRSRAASGTTSRRTPTIRTT